jgi:hypothetical protein
MIFVITFSSYILLFIKEYGREWRGRDLVTSKGHGGGGDTPFCTYLQQEHIYTTKNTKINVIRTITELRDRSRVTPPKKSLPLSRLANNQVTCQDLLACLLTYASKQASHEASFFPSKQVVEALLACLLVGLVG